MKIHTQSEIRYRTRIIEKGVIVKERPQKRNLILDNGLDRLAVDTYVEMLDSAVLGTGTTPVKRDSGAITVSITSEIATSSAGFFEAGDVGRLLKLDSGQEVYITGYTSATVVAVAGAGDDVASEFTIWYVDETNHETPVKTSTDRSNESSTFDGTKIVHSCTFTFSAEAAPITYSEIGWKSWGMTGLFGRDLIPAAGDSLAVGQQLQVDLELHITVSPLSQVPVANLGGVNYDTAGNMILAAGESAFSGFDANEPFRNTSPGLEPASTAGNCGIFVFTSDFILPTAFDADGSDSLGGYFSERKRRQVTIDSYSAGSFELTKRATFPIGEVNGSHYGVGFGYADVTNYTSPNLLIKYDSPQTKLNTQTLQLVFKNIWGRTLTN